MIMERGNRRNEWNGTRRNEVGLLKRTRLVERGKRMMMMGDFSMWTKRLSRFASHRSIDRLLGFPSLHRRRPGLPPFVRSFVRSFFFRPTLEHRFENPPTGSSGDTVPASRSSFRANDRSFTVPDVRGGHREDGRVRTNGRTDGPTDRDATMRAPRRSHPSFDHHRSRSRSRSLFDRTRRRGFFRGYAQNLGRKKA